jgi:hypothetical protein
VVGFVVSIVFRVLLSCPGERTWSFLQHRDSMTVGEGHCSISIAPIHDPIPSEYKTPASHQYHKVRAACPTKHEARFKPSPERRVEGICAWSQAPYPTPSVARCTVVDSPRPIIAIAPLHGRRAEGCSGPGTRFRRAQLAARDAVARTGSG